MIKTLQKHSPNTYKQFVLWIVKEIYKGDKNKYNNFMKTNWNYQLISFLYFLEKEHEVLIKDALDYYNVLKPTIGFFNQLKNVVLYEFHRIEVSKETNYIPF